MNKKALPLRIGVGVIVVNNKNKIFVGKRKDNPVNKWQMPQGGVNKNESFLTAMKRELDEETSIKNVELIHEVEEEISYNLPDNLLGIIWKGKFKGQTQKWYIMRFLGTDKEINLKTNHPEFLEWKWIDIKNITDKVVDFKLHVYEKIKNELNALI